MVGYTNAKYVRVCMCFADVYFAVEYELLKQKFTLKFSFNVFGIDSDRFQCLQQYFLCCAVRNFDQMLRLSNAEKSPVKKKGINSKLSQFKKQSIHVF